MLKLIFWFTELYELFFHFGKILRQVLGNPEKHGDRLIAKSF